MKKSFASDNNAGVHPVIMKALVAANAEHTVAYGEDDYTESAVRKFQEYFGPDVDVYFVFNGTGANVLGLQALTDSFEAVICARTAHINCDECGAPEKFTGCKLLTVNTPDGKLTEENILQHLTGFGNQHHSQPKVISISQSTELGTVYTPDEIKKVADLAHSHGLFLHMDGARLANAAASLGVSLKNLTGDAGVDVLSFGGTKNGMMYGEAVVFFSQELSRKFKYIRKQGMQLASKMRFIAAQFEALLSDNLWLNNAKHTNSLARLLATNLQDIPQVNITQPVQSNGVFATFPKRYIAELQANYFFYVWNEDIGEVRLMTSFDTTEEDILDFGQYVKTVLSK